MAGERSCFEDEIDEAIEKARVHVDVLNTLMRKVYKVPYVDEVKLCVDTCNRDIVGVEVDCTIDPERMPNPLYARMAELLGNPHSAQMDALSAAKMLFAHLGQETGCRFSDEKGAADMMVYSASVMLEKDCTLPGSALNEKIFLYVECRNPLP